MFVLIFLIFEILPVVLYVSYLKRNKHEGLRVIFIYTIVSFAMEFLAPLLIKKFGVGSFYLYTSWTIIEYSLLTLFIYRNIEDGRLKYIPIIGSLAFLATVITSCLKSTSGSFDSLTASVENVLIIIYSIIFLYIQIKDPTILFVYYSKKFWVVIAFFIYFSSTLFLFLYAGNFTKQQTQDYWYINYIFDIIKNIFFCIAFTMKKSKPQNHHVENKYADI